MSHIFHLDGHFIMLPSSTTKSSKIYCSMNINEKTVFHVWEKVGKRNMLKKPTPLYVIFDSTEMSSSFQKLAGKI